MKITKNQLRRIIKEEKAKIVKEYGLSRDDEANMHITINLALEHLQNLEDALHNAGIEVGMGQLRGIVQDALDRGGY